MRYDAVWLMSCGHERGFTRPKDEPEVGDEGQCWLCPAERSEGRVLIAPTRTYTRKVR